MHMPNLELTFFGVSNTLRDKIRIQYSCFEITFIQALLNATINLRYRFLPYTYSGFYRVETEGRTMQRALVFDYPNDLAVREIADQFFWGQALMVCPILTNQSKRSVCH